MEMIDGIGFEAVGSAEELLSRIMNQEGERHPLAGEKELLKKSVERLKRWSEMDTSDPQCSPTLIRIKEWACGARRYAETIIEAIENGMSEDPTWISR